MHVEGVLVLNAEPSPAWCIRGMRRDFNALGDLVAQLEVTRELFAGSPLYVASDSGEWIRGRVSFSHTTRAYYFETFRGEAKIEKLADLAARGALVRWVRA